jgi:hypothetical protein
MQRDAKDLFKPGSLRVAARTNLLACLKFNTGGYLQTAVFEDVDNKEKPS